MDEENKKANVERNNDMIMSITPAARRRSMTMSGKEREKAMEMHAGELEYPP